MEKVYTENGQKAYQRQGDKEDRSLPYRDWIRTVETNGLFIDIDFIKWKKKDGEYIPCAITELTRCDSETVGMGYRSAIIERLFRRDKQGHIVKQLGKLLQVPVYIVLFQKDMKWLWVFSLTRGIWREFTPASWAKYIKEYL